VDLVRETVRQPFLDYLTSSIDLARTVAADTALGQESPQ
jgi:hypothetical protein